MGLFNHAHALRAALVACGLAYFGPVGTGQAAPWQFDPALARAAGPTEPFHLFASPVFWGGIAAKWQSVAHKLDDERVQLALCDADRENCASDAALRLLSIVDGGRQREGRARLGEINRDQSGDPSDERPRPVRPGGRLEFAARHLLSRRR
jgi:hypothetical protein